MPHLQLPNSQPVALSSSSPWKLEGLIASQEYPLGELTCIPVCNAFIRPMSPAPDTTWMRSMYGDLQGAMNQAPSVPQPSMPCCRPDHPYKQWETFSPTQSSRQKDGVFAPLFLSAYFSLKCCFASHSFLELCQLWSWIGEPCTRATNNVHHSSCSETVQQYSWCSSSCRMRRAAVNSQVLQYCSRKRTLFHCCKLDKVLEYSVGELYLPVTLGVVNRWANVLDSRCWRKSSKISDVSYSLWSVSTSSQYPSWLKIAVRSLTLSEVTFLTKQTSGHME